MAIELRSKDEIARDKILGADQANSPSDAGVIYYGPYECQDCGDLIVRVALAQGGDMFT